MNESIMRKAQAIAVMTGSDVRTVLSMARGMADRCDIGCLDTPRKVQMVMYDYIDSIRTMHDLALQRPDVMTEIVYDVIKNSVTVAAESLETQS